MKKWQTVDVIHVIWWFRIICTLQASQQSCVAHNTNAWLSGLDAGVDKSSTEISLQMAAGAWFQSAANFAVRIFNNVWNSERWWVHVNCFDIRSLNSLRPSDTIWWQRSGSTLAQVIACCLTAPSHYLNQCRLIISEVQWHSYYR